MRCSGPTSSASRVGPPSFPPLLLALEHSLTPARPRPAELKTPSAQLSKAQATPPGYDAFLSLPASGKGYSGVGTWTRQGTVVAAGAEVGLLGLARGGKEGDEGVGGLARAEDYPPEPEVDADADAADEDDGAAADPADPIDPAELDAEGRTTVVDLSLFVLINVYCPALTNPARAPFRLAFLRALGARVRAMRREGREVVLVGDLNVVARPEDHGEGSLASKQEGFWDHPVRRAPSLSFFLFPAALSRPDADSTLSPPSHLPPRLNRPASGSTTSSRPKAPCTTSSAARTRRARACSPVRPHPLPLPLSSPLPSPRPSLLRGPRAKCEADEGLGRAHGPGWDTRTDARASNYGTRIDYSASSLPSLLSSPHRLSL